MQKAVCTCCSAGCALLSNLPNPILTDIWLQFVPAILRMLDGEQNKAETAELIVNIVTYKYPDLQEVEDVKIVLEAFLRVGRVAEALDLSRKIALASVQGEGDYDAEAVEQASQRTADLITFIFDTCYACKLYILS